MDRLTLTAPDDFHLHLRDGPILQGVVPHTARQFARALVMPNLAPPVTSTDQALAYRARILEAVPPGIDFQPLMALYLTEHTSAADVRSAYGNPAVAAFKLYPAGATTHSQQGITRTEKIYPVLEQMEKSDVPLLVHGESTDPDIDIFDREKVFLEQELDPIVERFPQLRVVVEHITTTEAVHFVQQAGRRVAATITAHHLLFNRNALLAGGIRPHYYCLPVLKAEPHRRALVDAATSGSTKFFAGTDSAPHPRSRKESACGCAGCYTAHAALEFYAEAFDQADALHRLDGFTSAHGASFYGLPRNTGSVTLVREPCAVPSAYPIGTGDDRLIPLRAGEKVAWSVLPRTGNPPPSNS